jgi:hypothetical protein
MVLLKAQRKPTAKTMDNFSSCHGVHDHVTPD